MKRSLLVGLAVLVTCATVLAPAASAKEKLLTFYSPKIHSLPYVHDTHSVTLKPDGKQAPAGPGYITGFAEQALVDSKDPNAKPLPIAKMMVHHFLYFARGRVDEAPGGCWSGAGFIGGRGEEHPLGRPQLSSSPEFRAKYGINNSTPDGKAPAWSLTAMVMNHYKRPKDFMVRTRVWYTTEKRTSVQPLVIGKCSQLLNGMSYDVPGGGKKGSNFVDKSDWVAPFNGRMLMASSHNHGGAKYQALSSLTCKRRLFKAPVYNAPNEPRVPDDPADPARAGTDRQRRLRQLQGASRSRRARCSQRVAVHDNHNLHVASMGFWATWFVKDDSVKECGKIPNDIVEINKPKRYDHTPDYDLKVPQLSKPQGAFSAFDGNDLTVGDDFFRPGRITAKVGQPVTWRFSGQKPHSVTVANGPRGFSSIYWGSTARHVHRHAEGEGHLPAGLPRPPHVDGGDAGRQVRRSDRRVPLRALSTLGARESGPPGSSTMRVVAQAQSVRVLARHGDHRQRAALLEAAAGAEHAPAGTRRERIERVDHQDRVAALLHAALGPLHRQLGGLRLRLGRAIVASADHVGAGGGPLGHFLGAHAHERHLHAQVGAGLAETGDDFAQERGGPRAGRARDRHAGAQPVGRCRRATAARRSRSEGKTAVRSPK